MRETWYVMEDGSVGDPKQISLDQDGKLRHKDGRAVAYAPHGPRSRGVDAEVERRGRDMKPEKPAKPPRRGYKTRSAKADEDIPETEGEPTLGESQAADED